MTCTGTLLYSPLKNFNAPLNLAFSFSSKSVIFILNIFCFSVSFDNSFIALATIFTSSSSLILTLPSTKTMLSTVSRFAALW